MAQPPQCARSADPAPATVRGRPQVRQHWLVADADLEAGSRSRAERDPGRRDRDCVAHVEEQAGTWVQAAEPGGRVAAGMPGGAALAVDREPGAVRIVSLARAVRAERN